MILACDTSALSKRYIREADSDQVNAAWSAAGLFGPAWVTEAEMLVTFARKRREGSIPPADIDRAEQLFSAD